MLSTLQIENIAVIESEKIEFGSGLNVLSGETGAGKSIVIGSLEAIVGGRKTREIIRSGTDFARVTAVFETAAASEWLKDNDISSEEVLIIKRSITADGKGRASVNASPVLISQLRDLGSNLLDIHGQSEQRDLIDSRRHLSYLDSFGDYRGLIETYREKFSEYKRVFRILQKLQISDSEKAEKKERLEFRIREIEAQSIERGEEQRLNDRREIVRNAEKLRESVTEAYSLLYGAENSAYDKLSSALLGIEDASRYAGELAELLPELNSALVIINESASRTNSLRNSLDFSADEYEQLEQRLAGFRYLEKKYGVEDADKLLDLLAEYKAELEDIELSGERAEALGRELGERRSELQNLCDKIRAERIRTAEILEEKLCEELRELSMPSVRFKIDVAEQKKFDDNGKDSVEFLISANVGEKPAPMSKIASGGELSRIMLALKGILAEKDEDRLMVFDEIDEGVSGIAAQKVGEKLAKLARTRQIICVTHLPQIAAMADRHFLIEKTESCGRTYTKIKKLDTAGRTNEIARMHGGANISEVTRKSALEQIQSANKFKENIDG